VILLDTNVLIDAFDPAAPCPTWASSLLRESLLGDGAAINPVILAELCVGDASSASNSPTPIRLAGASAAHRTTGRPLAWISIFGMAGDRRWFS
jgi:predicted nucleic acid-binding protein